MRVFISYSFIDRELYLLTLLVTKLREKGNLVHLSDGSYLSQNYILNSDLFVGIVTNNSDSINTVIKEWEIAGNNNLKRILLLEQGINVNQPDIEYIIFDRNNPQQAINQLFQENKNSDTKSSNVVEDLVTAGAVIAGIAALISLFSDNDNNKSKKKIKK